MENKNSIERMQSVEKLIANKMMLVDAKNYHVSMLAELWNMYYDDGKLHLCRNIKNYCEVQNAFDQLEKKEKPVLLISIKDSENKVAPYAYFKNGSIEIIENANALRSGTNSVKILMKLILRLIIAIAIILGILYLIF